MTSPTSRKKRLIIFLVFIVLFFLLIPVITLYATGYRLDKDLELKPTGGIYVYYPESGVNITVQGQPPQRTTIFAKSILIQNLAPGTYEIDASKDGYSYWKKNVMVKEKRVAEAYPFLVLEPLATSTIDADLKPTIEKLFASTTLLATATSTSSRSALSVVDKQSVGLNAGATSSSASSTLLNDEGVLFKDVYLYKEQHDKGDWLIALWKGETAATPLYFCEEETGLCDTSLVATESSSPIKHFDFYPSRNDIVIYSNSDGVFVTELDKRPEQNFVTLAKGNVDFRVYNGHIYIKDKNSLYEVIYD